MSAVQGEYKTDPWKVAHAAHPYETMGLYQNGLRWSIS